MVLLQLLNTKKLRSFGQAGTGSMIVAARASAHRRRRLEFPFPRARAHQTRARFLFVVPLDGSGRHATHATRKRLPTWAYHRRIPWIASGLVRQPNGSGTQQYVRSLWTPTFSSPWAKGRSSLSFRGGPSRAAGALAASPSWSWLSAFCGHVTTF